ncbi:HAMP domain-containing sensor histidine kinase [Allokutzneria multivorans]|uniref:histidine kinase n=1 Tax=Allokutzneria multivorans TaxID=1142134 RepID=A0ABP7S5G7_9PSEU
MRSRLLTTVLSLLVLVLAGLGVPLAATVAGAEQQRLFLDRLTDVTRFASLAQRPIIDDQPSVIERELRRYDEVYRIAVAITDRDGTVVARSRPGLELTDREVIDRVGLALAGRHSEPGELMLPWHDAPLVLAAPVLADGEVRGAALIISPTSSARGRVVVWWGALLLGSLLALGAGILFALPVVRWILKPVQRLDQATGKMVTALVMGRPVEPVGGNGGPPELRMLTRSFEQMAAAVGDVLAAQRAFVADASHQLRNPLTALRLRLGNLEGHVDAEAEVHHEAAIEETDRLNRLLDELLVMARAEASSLEPVPIDVDDIVIERLQAWSAVADSRHVELVQTGETDLVAMLTPRGMEGILDALLDNALKFTHDGTVVEVGARRVDNRVELSVRDEGPGLRQKELERATDRFWRSPSHQNVPGSGLGLAIVTRIVARVDGNVRLELPKGGGLRVVVTMPLAPPERSIRSIR